jgi:putative transposase
MKRHSHEEISAKLQLARQLEGQGKPQAEICKALGISVMTFHRWRKDVRRTLPHQVRAASNAPVVPVDDPDELVKLIEDLKLENSRLRKIVGDLLLEKLRIEEEATATSQPPKALRPATIRGHSDDEMP